MYVSKLYCWMIRRDAKPVFTDLLMPGLDTSSFPQMSGNGHWVFMSMRTLPAELDQKSYLPLLLLFIILFPSYHPPSRIIQDTFYKSKGPTNSTLLQFLDMVKYSRYTKIPPILFSLRACVSGRNSMDCKWPRKMNTSFSGSCPFQSEAVNI